MSAIELLIGTPELGWEIFQEPHNLDEIRACTCVNFEALSKDAAAIIFLKQMSQLYTGNWRISGLTTLNTDEPMHLIGFMNIDKPSPVAPALTTVQIEVEEGKLTGRSNGGWKLGNSGTTIHH